MLLLWLVPWSLLLLLLLRNSLRSVVWGRISLGVGWWRAGKDQTTSESLESNQRWSGLATGSIVVAAKHPHVWRHPNLNQRPMLPPTPTRWPSMGLDNFSARLIHCGAGRVLKLVLVS